jgi:hypothetical protein
MTLRQLIDLLTGIADDETLNKEVIIDGNSNLVQIKNRKHAIILTSFYASDATMSQTKESAPSRSHE